MNNKIDHCEPFDGKKENLWMKAEHIGRYLFAADYFEKIGARKIVDIACAEGYGTKILTGRGFTVCGADISSDYIEVAKRRCQGLFFVVDLETQPLPAAFEPSDGAVCFETIEHLEDGNVLLSKLHDCLNSGGTLLLSFPNSAFEKFDENGINYDPFHLRVYTREGMKDMVEKNGFVLKEEYGQSLCNLLYVAESSARRAGLLTQKEIDELFRYDGTSILNLSKLIGYPNKKMLKRSYSFLWILKRL